jgi:hypothetical protein
VINSRLMLKHLVRGLVVGVVCTGMLACSGDDDDDAAQPDSASVTQCKNLIGAYCPAIIDCAVSGELVPADQRDATVDACASGAESALDCSRAVGVSDTYDECMDWLAAPDCDYVIDALNSDGATSPLPAICNQVIQLL